MERSSRVVFLGRVRGRTCSQEREGGSGEEGEKKGRGKERRGEEGDVAIVSLVLCCGGFCVESFVM